MFQGYIFILINQTYLSISQLFPLIFSFGVIIGAFLSSIVKTPCSKAGTGEPVGYSIKSVILGSVLLVSTAAAAVGVILASSTMKLTSVTTTGKIDMK